MTTLCQQIFFSPTEENQKKKPQGMGAVSSKSSEIKARFEKLVEKQHHLNDTEKDIYAFDVGSQALKNLKLDFYGKKLLEVESLLKNLKKIREEGLHWTYFMQPEQIEDVFRLELKRKDIPDSLANSSSKFQHIQELKKMTHQQLHVLLQAKRKAKRAKRSMSDEPTANDT